MNARQRSILHMLEEGSRTSSEIASSLSIPEPSVRRTIQTLRAQGHNISFADSYTGLYRLGRPILFSVEEALGQGWLSNWR